MTSSTMNPKYLAIIYLIPTLTLAVNETSESATQSPAEGIVFVPFASPYELVCSLNLTHVADVDYLIFYRNDKLINNRLVTLFDESTVKLRLYDAVTARDRFFVKVYKGQQIDLLEFGCENASNFPLPREVQNFTCLSSNLVTLTCWWQAENFTPTIYTIEFTPISSETFATFSCADDSSSNSCTWTFNATSPYLSTARYLNFTVYAFNKFGSRNQTFRIEHATVLRASAPFEVSLVDRTSSSISFKWRIGHLKLFPDGWIYQIVLKFNCTASNHSSSRIFHQNDLMMVEDTLLLNYTGLPYANTDYRFEISMKTASSKQDNWSRPSVATIRSRAAIPSLAPTVIGNGFQILDVRGDRRDVLIYWLPVPREHQNGDDFYYEITVFEENRIKEVIAMKPNNHNSQHVITNVSYKFLIRSANAEGLSNVSSTLIIPAQRQILPPPTSIQIHEGNVTRLVWQERSDIGVDKVTAFTCKASEKTPCEEIIEFMTFSGNNHDIERLARSENAVAISSSGLVSGLIVPKYSIKKDQIGLVSGLEVQKEGPYDISITWSVDYNDVISLLGIKGYMVHYCPTNFELCEQPEAEVVIKNAQVNQTIITNLKPFSIYRISVSSTFEGGTGPRSEFLFAKTLETAPDLEGFQFLSKNISSSWIQLEWNPPMRTNGVITHYLVQYNDKKVLVHDTRVMLANLKSNTNYSVEVRACNSKCSEPIGPQVMKTKALVSKVECVRSHRINSTHVEVEWDTATMANKTELDYYLRIQFRENNSSRMVDDAEEIILIPKGRVASKISAVIAVTAGRGGA